MDFTVLENILEKTLGNNLMLSAKDTPLLLTESSVHMREMRMKLTEFLFEKF